MNDDNIDDAETIANTFFQLFDMAFRKQIYDFLVSMPVSNEQEALVMQDALLVSTSGLLMEQLLNRHGKEKSIKLLLDYVEAIETGVLKPTQDKGNTKEVKVEAKAEIQNKDSNNVVKFTLH